MPEVRLTGGSRTGDLYFVGGEKIAPAKLQEDYCLSIGTIAERFFFPLIQVSFSLDCM